MKYSIQRVRKQGDQKILCIPKKSGFEIGDFVLIFPLQINAEFVGEIVKLPPTSSASQIQDGKG